MGHWRQDAASIRTYSELHKHRRAILDGAERAAIAMWRRSRKHELTRQGCDAFKWGEEIEYLLASANEHDWESRANGVSYSQARVLSDLEAVSGEASSPNSDAKHTVDEPEYQPVSCGCGE